MKHPTVERVGSESSGFPELTAISCVNQLIMVQRYSRDRGTSGKTRPGLPGNRAVSGAEVGCPETTGMSDNG